MKHLNTTITQQWNVTAIVVNSFVSVDEDKEKVRVWQQDLALSILVRLI